MTTDFTAVTDEAIQIRHYLHQHPEVSDQEVATSAYLRDRLRTLGYRIITPAKLKTGVVAELGHGHPVVALRSDIDALPIHEATGLAYASVNPGVMHACGHDFHMASLLGAAQALKDADFAGTIRLIFQPAEETHVGAQEVMESGGAEGIDAIIGFHNKPDLAAGEVGILEGGLMAAVDQFKVILHGKGTHAAKPELGRDPIVALTSLVNSLQTIVSRNVDPQAVVVLSVTHISGGNTWNVIPETASFEGTVRSFSTAGRKLAKQRFMEIVKAGAATFDVTPEIEWIKGPDVVNNDDQLTPLVAETTAKFARVVRPVPSTTGEDFAYFSQRIPSVFAFVGSHGTSDWHHPDLKLDDQALTTGIKFFYYNALNLLAKLR